MEKINKPEGITNKEWIDKLYVEFKGKGDIKKLLIEATGFNSNVIGKHLKRIHK